MKELLDKFLNSYAGYAGYLWDEITNPSMHNYFYWLIAVSLFFFGLEWLRPWRRDQPRFRKDFWLDAFYMFFNFFLFSLIIYNALSDVVVDALNNFILSFSGFDLQASNPLQHLPQWGILLIGFFLRDFIQWWVHRLLHRSDTLWEYHKVHHSVEQMGFAAHLRFHWMETVVYRTLEYLPLALLGIGLYDFFVIHIFALAIGHYNHSNISVSGYIPAAVIGALGGVVIAYGLFDAQLIADPNPMTRVGIILGSSLVVSVILGPFMKYFFNSPEMHIWHHSYDLPEDRKYGINFGLSLSIWDWLLGTAYVPYDGKDIALGFPGVEKYPSGFFSQVTHGFRLRKTKNKGLTQDNIL